MKFLSDEKRILALKISVSIFFIVGILMSFKLWHSDRLFPLCPVVDGFPILPESIDRFVPTLLIISLFVGIFIRRKVFYFGLFALLLFLLLQDQVRWQPWVYLYVCMLIPFAATSNYSKSLLPFFQILIIGVYFWSGFHKIGPGFMEGTFDKMLEQLLLIEDPETRQSLHFLGYSVPIIEILISIGLIFRKTRHVSMILAIGMHIIILTYLIVAGHNSIVYPWNIAMIFFVVISFYKSENKLNFVELRTYSHKLLIGSAVLFYLILPVFNLVGLWDNYLSFKLYSGTNGSQMVGLDKTEYKKIDPSIYPYFWTVDEPKDKYWIYLSKWTLEELNVPFYPEIRTLKQIGRYYCDGDIRGEKLEFIQFNKGFSREGSIVIHCEDID